MKQNAPAPSPEPEVLAVRMDVIETAAQEAARRVWNMRHEFVAREKRPDDWVTDADREADRLIREAKNRFFPGDGWLSEESLESSETDTFTWVVDPIDGTHEYVTGNPEHSVSIGLVWKGRAIGGAIAHPPSGVLMAGSIRTGLRPAETSHLPGGRGHEAGWRILVSRTDLGQERYSSWPSHLRLTPVGSIAYKLALVAYGEGDATVSITSKHPWDVMGGFAILQAVGIMPMFLDGNEHPLPSTNQAVPPFVVARDPSLAQELLTEARRIWKR